MTVVLILLTLVLGLLAAFHKQQSRKARLIEITLAVVTAFGTYYWHWSQGQAARKAAMSGVLSGAVNAGDPHTVRVFFGTNEIDATLNAVPDGVIVYPFRLCPLPALEDVPVAVKLAGGRMLVTARVTSWDGKAAAEINDNEWVVNPAGAWQRNYDDRTVEIIDNYGLPVLQVELKDDSTMHVGGVFFIDSSVVFIGQGGTLMTGRPTSVDQLRPDAGGVHRWFRYPSDQHIGERAK